MTRTTEACLASIFPDATSNWVTERIVVRSLIEDGELRRDLVILLDGWLPETPFKKVLLKHPYLTAPLVYERGEGEGPFFQRLMMRELGA